MYAIDSPDRAEGSRWNTTDAAALKRGRGCSSRFAEFDMGNVYWGGGGGSKSPMDCSSVGDVLIPNMIKGHFVVVLCPVEVLDRSLRKGFRGFRCEDAKDVSAAVEVWSSLRRLLMRTVGYTNF